MSHFYFKNRIQRKILRKKFSIVNVIGIRLTFKYGDRKAPAENNCASSHSSNITVTIKDRDLPDSLIISIS